MLFKYVLIDVFNLAYRKSSSNNCVQIANDVIDFINIDVKKRLDPDGAVYLLFDPLPKSDLGLSKAFKYSPRMRKEIVGSYKKNRTYNPQVGEAISLLKKYYTFRGDKYKMVISDDLEADDYVEQLIGMLDGNIALITTDCDWCRYISDKVVMINRGFDDPYTKDEYTKEFGIVPTIATVTLKKAIYGDKSDNIESIFAGKKFNSSALEDISDIMLVYIANENMSFKEVEKHIKGAEFTRLFKIKDRNPLEEFEYELLAVDTSIASPFSALLDNIRVIKSRCDDVKKYITFAPENKKYNDLMDVTLKRAPGVKKEIKFGALKA